jgi:hypothetical protein
MNTQNIFQNIDKFASAPFFFLASTYIFLLDTLISKVLHTGVFEISISILKDRTGIFLSAIVIFGLITTIITPVVNLILRIIVLYFCPYSSEREKNSDYQYIYTLEKNAILEKDKFTMDVIVSHKESMKQDDMLVKAFLSFIIVILINSYYGGDLMNKISSLITTEISSKFLSMIIVLICVGFLFPYYCSSDDKIYFPTKK